jgi:hypothetical protein
MARGHIPLREEGELEDINGKAFTFFIGKYILQLKMVTRYDIQH